MRAPNPAAVQSAYRALLKAAGFDLDHPALAETPARAAEAFLDGLTPGYGSSAEEALGAGFPVSGEGPLLATGIPLLFVCPHHLLPARGFAHVAITPNARVPGLGRIPRLIDTLSRRLVLQEDLTEQLAHALAHHLEAKGAVAIVEARHGCVAVEDFARSNTVFRTRASVGPRRITEPLLEELQAALAPGTDLVFHTDDR